MEDLSEAFGLNPSASALDQETVSETNVSQGSQSQHTGRTYRAASKNAAQLDGPHTAPCAPSSDDGDSTQPECPNLTGTAYQHPHPDALASRPTPGSWASSDELPQRERITAEAWPPQSACARRSQRVATAPPPPPPPPPPLPPPPPTPPTLLATDVAESAPAPADGLDAKPDDTVGPTETARLRPESPGAAERNRPELTSWLAAESAGSFEKAS